MTAAPSMEAFLRKRVEYLELQVEALEQALHGLSGKHPVVAGLTPNETRIFAMIRKRSPNAVRRSSIMDAMYALRAVDEQPTIKVIDVLVCRGRKKLKPFGIEIKTVWGVGYSMDAESAARWDQEAGHAAQPE